MKDKPIKPTIKLCVDFPRNDYAILRALSIERGISMKQIMTDALIELKEKWVCEDIGEEQFTVSINFSKDEYAIIKAICNERKSSIWELISNALTKVKKEWVSEGEYGESSLEVNIHPTYNVMEESKH